MGTLTEAQYWSRVRSAFRKAFQWWRPAQAALKLARVSGGYRCAQCGMTFKRGDVQIDHTTPCGSLNCYADLEPFLKRLTHEDVNGYDVLCTACHRAKTKSEREARKK